MAMSITFPLSWSIWDPWRASSLNMHTQGSPHVAVRMSLLRMFPIPTLICVWNLWAPHVLPIIFFPLLTQQLHGLLHFWTFWRWPHVTLASRHVSRPPSIKGLNMFELHPWVLSSIHSKHLIFFPQLSPSSHMLSTVKSWTYQKKIRWRHHASESHWAEPDLALMIPELPLQGN